MSPLLYALLREEAAGPFGAGMAGEPLREVPLDGLTAVVGELSARPKVGAEALAAYDAAVRRIAERASAVLPARFGEWLADDAALAQRVAERRAALAAALDLVAGCAQMTLRVFGEPAEELGPAAEAASQPTDPEDAAGGPGARWLAARARELARQRAVPEIAPLCEALSSFVRAERTTRHPAAGPLLASVHHLVRREETAGYLAVVEAARGRLGGRRVTVSGPWPPYAFAPGADA